MLLQGKKLYDRMTAKQPKSVVSEDPSADRQAPPRTKGSGKGTGTTDKDKDNGKPKEKVKNPAVVALQLAGRLKTDSMVLQSKFPAEDARSALQAAALKDLASALKDQSTAQADLEKHVSTAGHAGDLDELTKLVGILNTKNELSRIAINSCRKQLPKVTKP